MRMARWIPMALFLWMSAGADAGEAETCRDTVCYRHAFPWNHTPVSLVRKEDRLYFLGISRPPWRAGLWHRRTGETSWQSLPLPADFTGRPGVSRPAREPQGLCVNRLDDLWLLGDGGAVYHYDGRRWQHHPELKEPVQGLGCGGGSLVGWTGDFGTLYRAAAGGWQPVERPGGEGGDEEIVRNLHVDEEGRLWADFDSAGIHVLEKGSWHPWRPEFLERMEGVEQEAMVLHEGWSYPVAEGNLRLVWMEGAYRLVPEPPESITLAAFIEGEDGRFAVMGIIGEGVEQRWLGWVREAGGWKPLSIESPEPTGDWQVMDGPGRVLVLDDQGQARLFSVDGPPRRLNPRYRRLVVLGDGTQVALGQGMAIWRSEAGWRLLEPPPPGVVTAAAGPDPGAMVVAAPRGRLYRRQGSSWVALQGCSLDPVLDLALGADGSLYLVGGSVHRNPYTGEVTWPRLLRRQGERCEEFVAESVNEPFERILFDDRGRVTVWNRSGGFRLEADGLVPLAESESLCCEGGMHRLGEDLWFGSSSLTFHRWRAGRTERFRWPAGEAPDPRMVGLADFLPGAQGPLLAAGTGVGESWAGLALARLEDDRWKIFFHLPGARVRELGGTPERWFFVGDSGLLGVGGLSADGGASSVAQVDALERQAAEAVRQGAWQRALELLEQAQALQPDDGREGRIHRIRAYLELGADGK